ncbi:MAG: helix-turn-helix transcriptional regulator [Blastocatellia bacterium]|nr:helix-turn-helix transcriptional regulator [Blastocatellia bacterium]
MPSFRFRGKRYHNPVELALDIIGGKWKMPILWRLKDRTCRYGELKRSLTATSHKVLAEQLRELERDGLVERRVFAQIPPKVEYSITELGRSVIPLIEELRLWGSRFRAVSSDSGGVLAPDTDPESA